MKYKTILTLQMSHLRKAKPIPSRLFDRGIFSYLTWVALYMGSTRLLTIGGFGMEILLSCVQKVGMDPRI